MSLHLGEDHGALHERKAQFTRGLAVLGRKQSMLLPQSAADVYRAGCAAKEGIAHRSMIGRQRESAFYASYSKCAAGSKFMQALTWIKILTALPCLSK
ncbi:hypothetical protein IVB14_29915 [Bradyrhizobium sp. 180]|uniref:hypothetical protein n=1 Tax=unclassified Bradyrhizobium TaxID=2631580 RepID=UPI001FF7CBCA|nr:MULTISPECIES: hypothetical protein [unclassified Bradyrhizobium]MCK1419295.1 hypothetical protein [Bradyrhizobium sp. CW12]MCK1494513.1 hypothetical protein [Bradyrhizobium sp. 180]MCK1526956.1 hypothetical protein [Bradyrhizobium sp. 182]MCK1595379.1 hypothetical protein [Bradyrhizobium sp. 164]MCK1620296.1 hypothetical protein [Bradyrhizobium sp. 159]